MWRNPASALGLGLVAGRWEAGRWRPAGLHPLSGLACARPCNLRLSFCAGIQGELVMHLSSLTEGRMAPRRSWPWERWCCGPPGRQCLLAPSPGEQQRVAGKQTALPGLAKLQPEEPRGSASLSWPSGVQGWGPSTQGSGAPAGAVALGELCVSPWSGSTRLGQGWEG